MTEERKDLVVSGPALPLAVVDPNTPESPERVVVVAKNPEELNKSQARLIEWAAKRVAKEKAELKDLEENLTLATERKWRTIHLKRLVQAKEKQVIFYEKVEAALKDGYYIIPELPMDVFAIRTVRRHVKENRVTATGYAPNVRDQLPSQSPLGEGRYVSPHAETDTEQRTIPHPSQAGRELIQVTRTAFDWMDVDFPFLTTAKPEVIKATTAAMDKLIFDEMGVAPVRRVVSDPMVIGTVIHRANYVTKRIHFLVAWFLDTDTL